MGEKLKEDIAFLKVIHQQLEEYYNDTEWAISSYDEIELERITGLIQHDWDDNNLAHFIDGMQRAIRLKEIYWKNKR